MPQLTNCEQNKLHYELRASKQKGKENDKLCRSGAILYSIINLFVSFVINPLKKPEDYGERHVTSREDERVNHMGHEHRDPTNGGFEEQKDGREKVLGHVVQPAIFRVFCEVKVCPVEQSDRKGDISRYVVNGPECLVMPSQGVKVVQVLGVLVTVFIALSLVH